MTFATFGNMAGLAQIWTLTVIAYDRAMAIFYPLRREKRMRHSQVHSQDTVQYTARTQYSQVHSQDTVQPGYSTARTQYSQVHSQDTVQPGHRTARIQYVPGHSAARYRVQLGTQGPSTAR